MDNTQGNFKEINNEQFKEQLQKEDPRVFKVEEIIEVRGSRLRVHKIYKNKITFKLLPQEKAKQKTKESLKPKSQ